MKTSNPICTDGSKFGSICKLCPEEEACKKLYGVSNNQMLFRNAPLPVEAPKERVRTVEI